MNTMIIVWFCVLILMLFIEITTVNLVSIWFVIGAFASCIVAYFTDNLFIQIGVFIVVSAIMLILMRPIIKKMKKQEKTPTNIDRIIGMTAIVTEEIDKNVIGEVKVDGKRWSAVSKEKIEKDTTVKVKAIDGVKLVVEKEEK